MTTVYNPPKKPISTAVEITGQADIMGLNGDGVTRFVREELRRKGVTYFNMSDGRMVKMEVIR